MVTLLCGAPSVRRRGFLSMCDLCELAERTRVYHDDPLIRIIDCESCGVPMAVIKRHDDTPNIAEVQRIRQVVADIGITGQWDDACRQIPSHWHVHFR